MDDIGQSTNVTLCNYASTSFVTNTASHAESVSLFDPGWMSHIPVPGLKSGKLALFTEDVRPKYVVQKFGDIRGWRVLELGSFEGAHSYQLEGLGAEVLGIEANPFIFLRSLVVKNILSLKAQFLLGDFQKYLQETSHRYELIFCCGVLYHMQDPMELIFQISLHTDRVFLWTHYVSDKDALTWKKTSINDNHDFKCKYFRYDYAASRQSRPYGGIATFCNRVTKDDILCALKKFGFNRVEVITDDIHHRGGPALNLVAERVSS